MTDRVFVLVDETGRMLALTSGPDNRLLTRSPALARHFATLPAARDHLKLLDAHATRRCPIRFSVESLPAALMPGGALAGLTIA